MRKELFPGIEPFQTGMLELDDTHVMYWEVSGNADGVPERPPAHRRFFDPAHYRIIIFDQRRAEGRENACRSNSFA